MLMSRRRALAAPPPDPFDERRQRSTVRLQLLGGNFEFEADHPRLRQIVRAAYAGLPAHRLSGRTPLFRIRLTSAPGRISRSREPGLIRPIAGDGLLCGVLDGSSFASLTPANRAALIVVARDLLAHSYHVRYELLEFAVYVLAARARHLVPLHAACLAHGGTGVLIMGASGSGKSTLVLQAVLSGLQLVGEDSVLVQPQGLRATGIASYIHVRPDALRFLAGEQRRALLRCSARIRRRSGVAKLEIDIRGERARLAAIPAPIRAVVFLSRRRGQRELLHALSSGEMLKRLAASQRYAACQPGWQAFCARIGQLRAYELRRGAHPREAVDRLRILLAGAGRGTAGR
jgi:energy-coupling factor transporter ATP-binding protein EcfA2